MPTFYERFQHSAQQFPHKIALEIQRQDRTESLTFAQLQGMAESVGSWLTGKVERDSRVAILAANHPRWVAAYLGIICAGRVAVPLDTAFHADQVAKLLKDSGASILFCDAKHLAVAQQAADGLPVGLVMTSAANEQVARVLASRGFTQEQVNQRLAQLSPQDLHQLAQNLDQLQAAGITKQEWIWIGIGALAVLIIVVATS